MTIRVLEPAARELDEAVGYYNGQVAGLGDAFLIETVKVFRLIERHPHAWQRLSVQVRRCRMGRFPYGVVYAIEGEEVVVLAVSHLHRRPGYWRDRLRQEQQ